MEMVRLAKELFILQWVKKIFYMQKNCHPLHMRKYSQKSS